MKAVICLLALSAVLAQSAVLNNASTRQNLNIGSISAEDRLLARWYLNKMAANTIQSDEFIYIGDAIREITAIQANEVGDPQGANISIIGGGLYQNTVTLRVESLQGYGYHYQIAIWGR